MKSVDRQDLPLDYLKIVSLSAPTSVLREDLQPMHDQWRSERNSSHQADLEDLQHHLLEKRLELASHRLPSQLEQINRAFMVAELVQHYQ
jgi:hypothetical protein